jgi:hypothetical protein
MKQGCIFLVLAGLVLIGAAPARGDSAPALMPAAQSCPAAASQPLLPAAPASPQDLALMCGSCSNPSCVGAKPMNVCELPGLQGLGRCQISSGCSGGGFLCVCTSGPPP